MRMPIISDLFKEEEFKLAVTTESKNLVERWFDLLGYPKDNLYFFNGDKVNSFEEITVITCPFEISNKTGIQFIRNPCLRLEEQETLNFILIVGIKYIFHAWMQVTEK